MLPIKALFICENPHEAESLIPVAKAMALTGLKVEYEFASLDSFLFQGTDKVLKAAKVPYFSIPISRALKKPITECSPFHKLYIPFASHNLIKKIVDRFDAVVCGVDLDITRILLFEAQKQGKPTFQIVNAFVVTVPGKGKSVARIMKNFVKNALATVLNADFLRPKGIGQSNCDRIFVMGRIVKQVLASMGVDESRIIVSGVPRYGHLFNRRTERHSYGGFIIFYATGAHIWHGDLATHLQQQTQLRQIVDMLEEMGQDYKLVLKIHPREDREDYEWLCHRKQVEIFDKDADIYSAIEESDMVLSIGSTILFEAVVMNRPSAVLLFPKKDWAFDLFIPGKELCVVETIEELRQLITEISLDNVKYRMLVEKELAIIGDYIYSETLGSAENIAREICNVMADYNKSIQREGCK